MDNHDHKSLPINTMKDSEIVRQARHRSLRWSAGCPEIPQHLDQAGLPVGDAAGLGKVAKGVLHDHLILPLAEQQADGGRVVRVTHQVVHTGNVQVLIWPTKAGLNGTA